MSICGCLCTAYGWFAKGGRYAIGNDQTLSPPPLWRPDRLTLTDSVGLALLYYHGKNTDAYHIQECIMDSPGGFDTYREALMDYWRTRHGLGMM